MAEIGAGEMEISPIKSLQKRIKREVGNLRKAIAVTGMARRTILPDSQQERTLDERFERGEMFRIIKRILKKRATASSFGTDKEKEIWNQRFHAAVEISRDLRGKLDRLNRQYYNPEYMQLVDVEVLGEPVGIPVRRYSLRDNAKPEDKVPPPIIIIGGATSGPNVTKSTAEAYALQYSNRDVYVIGYPDSNKSEISEALPSKMKKQADLSTYTKINKDVLLKMGFESFDLVGISMGGGIVLQAATDTAFAKRIDNLIAISPTSVQETKAKMSYASKFAWEYINMRMHPQQWLRVPQKQPGPGYKLDSHKGMGNSVSGEISRPKSLSADDLAGIKVQGRVIIGTGKNDVLISCEQIKKETTEANEKRAATRERPIEFMEVAGGHHSMGDAYAAGIVALIRRTETLPEKVSVQQLANSTARVLVREDPRLAPVADDILS